MNVKTNSLIVLLITVLLVTCVSLRRDFKTSDLLIPVELLPPTLEVSPAGVKTKGSNNSYISLKTLTDKFTVSEHYVYQFGSIGKAQRWYERQFPSEFNNNSIAINGSWTQPDNWRFQSLFALKSHVACAINNIVEEKLVCEYMAQYEEFVVIYWSIIRPDTMTIEQFEEVIEGIDGIMVTYLEE